MTLTAAHLVFALAMAGYILTAIQFEEHDLIDANADAYHSYRQRVPMLAPWPHKSVRVEVPTQPPVEIRS